MSLEPLKNPAPKKRSPARGPVMLVLITVLLGYVGLKVTGSLGIMDTQEWIGDYKGIFLGLLFVVFMAAVGAALLIVFKKAFGRSNHKSAWGAPDEPSDD